MEPVALFFGFGDDLSGNCGSCIELALSRCANVVSLVNMTRKRKMPKDTILARVTLSCFVFAKWKSVLHRKTFLVWYCFSVEEPWGGRGLTTFSFSFSFSFPFSLFLSAPFPFFASSCLLLQGLPRAWVPCWPMAGNLPIWNHLVPWHELSLRLYLDGALGELCVFRSVFAPSDRVAINFGFE